MVLTATGSLAAVARLPVHSPRSNRCAAARLLVHRVDLAGELAVQRARGAVHLREDEDRDAGDDHERRTCSRG